MLALTHPQWVRAGSEDAIVPDYYHAFAIAAKLGCSVMDLETTPLIYQSWASVVLQAEARVWKELET